MTTELEIGLYIFMLAGFLGYHLITRVPPLLHTPLMSATNAMSGISLIGSLVVAGAGHGAVSTAFGFVAVACSSTNVVGGFLITDRMLKMFKKEHEQTARRASWWMSRPARLVLAVLLAGLLAAVYWFQEWRAYLRGADFSEVLKFSYILSAALFILGLKGLSSPRYARKGMFLAEFGMVMAVVGTLFHPAIVTYKWIVFGLILGSLIGGSMGLSIPMTAVPQRTALSHSLGALAATLIGISEYIRHGGVLGTVLMTTIGAEVVIGGLTFTGSLMAAAKLQELLPGAPITYRGQNASNIILLAVMVGSLIYLIVTPSAAPLFYLLVGLSLLFGVLLVVPIGAADMPVVISLLNSYAGLADAALGFVLMNKIQIITGSLDGT
ncbi:MAG: NAD(P)(+) transhydrogenase (Re/Si-specific) subunit beta, partial [Gemmatimonadales bacterium]